MSDDKKTADQLMEAVALLMSGGSDGLVGAKALLREIRDRNPDAVLQSSADIQLRRLGLKKPANVLSL